MKSFLSIFLLMSIIVQAQNGIIRSYYANHKIRERLSYVNDVLDSKNIWYYDNGNIKSIKTFDLGKLNGEVTDFYKSGLVKEDYSVADGIRDGVDRIYWKNGALKEIRYYDMGKLVKRVTIENDPMFVPNISDYKGIISNKKKIVKKAIPLCDVDICPTPIGGIQAIQDKVIYPKAAKLYGLEGKVSVVAAIDTAGFVTFAEVVKGLGLGCSEAALKAVKKSRFLPGLNNGKVVKSHLTITLEFKLNKKPLASAEKSKLLKIGAEQPDVDKMLTETDIEDSTDIFITQSGEGEHKFTNNKNFIEHDSSKTESTNKRTAEIKTVQKIKSKENAKIKYAEKIISCELDTCPQPAGGVSALLKRFKIPQRAYKLKLNGEIIIKAKIDKWGNVLDTKVLKGVGYGVGTAAEVAVLFTKFKPGIKNGQPVAADIKIVLPVKTTDK